VDVHLPVTTVVISVVKLKLEASSVPDVVIALGDGNGVLGVALHNPGSAVSSVSLPQHRAAGSKAGTNHADLLVDHAIIEPDVVSGSPVVSSLAEPLAVDDEPFRKPVNKWIGDSLGEASEKVKSSMTLPGQGPGEIWETVSSKSLAPLSPLMLTVSPAKTVSIGFNGLVVQGTEQMPVEVHSVLVLPEVPVAINDCRLFVPPVSWEILTLQNTEFPVVASDLDARFPELDVLVDVSSVSSTAIDLEGHQSVNVDLPVASGRREPVRGPLTNDLSLADRAGGLEVLGNALDVANPSALSAADLVRGPNVSAILAPPVPGHVVRVFLGRILDRSILDPAKSVVRESSPEPGAVVERRSLADSAVRGGDSVLAIGGSRNSHEIAVERPAQGPGVVQCRHCCFCLC